MTTWRILCWLGAFALVPAVHASGDEVRKAVEAGNAAFVAAFEGGDADAIGRLYTADAKVIAPGSPIASGRAAIAAHWKAGMAGVKNVALQTHDVGTAGDLAYEDGTVTIVSTAGEKTVARYLVVWKREGGEWKLHRDIWNQ
jgi:uncharacterized protein (TIGR02246 family)